MQTVFSADSEWNSNIKVATQINATFWSIEVALPREMLEKLSKSDLQDKPALENRWFFNIHRKAYSSSVNTANLAAYNPKRI